LDEKVFIYLPFISDFVIISELRRTNWTRCVSALFTCLLRFSNSRQACFSFLSISKYHDVNCGLWNSFPRSTCSLRSLIPHVRRFSNLRSRENIHRLFTYSWISTIKILGRNLWNLRVRVWMRDLALNVKAILLFVYESSKCSLKHKTRTRARRFFTNF